MTTPCPECGSPNVRGSNAQGLLERIGRVFGYVQLRCRDCEHRFTYALYDVRNAVYARCPRCYRLDLTRFEPDHYRMGRFATLMMRLGAKTHRCAACRCNFVSFRPAKMKYVRTYYPGGGAAH